MIPSSDTYTKTATILAKTMDDRSEPCKTAKPTHWVPGYYKTACENAERAWGEYSTLIDQDPTQYQAIKTKLHECLELDRKSAEAYDRWQEELCQKNETVSAGTETESKKQTTNQTTRSIS